MHNSRMCTKQLPTLVAHALLLLAGYDHALLLLAGYGHALLLLAGYGHTLLLVAHALLLLAGYGHQFLWLFRKRVVLILLHACTRTHAHTYSSLYSGDEWLAACM